MLIFNELRLKLGLDFNSKTQKPVFTAHLREHLIFICVKFIYLIRFEENGFVMIRKYSKSQRTTLNKVVGQSLGGLFSEIVKNSARLLLLLSLRFSLGVGTRGTSRARFGSAHGLRINNCSDCFLENFLEIFLRTGRTFDVLVRVYFFCHVTTLAF